MENSFQGEVLRQYRNWVSSGFLRPSISERARDYLLHITKDPAAEKATHVLWPHQREAVRRAVYASELLAESGDGYRSLLLNVVTGGGKTVIIAALMAYLRTCKDVRSFLLLTPNTIVRERLKADFERSGRKNSVWKRFNLFSPEFSHYVHDMTLHVLQPSAGSAGIRGSAIVLGNIHQLYPSSPQGQENLSVVLHQMGRIAVFNDEAHNTVAPQYDTVLRHLANSGRTTLRIDTTATPDRADGQQPDSRMIYNYGIKDAVRDRVIKTVFVCKPSIKNVQLTYENTETREVVRVEDVPWEEIDSKKISSTRWVTSEKCLRQQLGMAVRRLDEQRVRARGRHKPILFVVAVSVKDAYNAKRVLEGEFNLKTFVIASKDEDGGAIGSDERQRELKVAMTLGTSDDSDEHDAVVSVLMLREGWDVRSVAVIALLRKFSSKVYGQQVIGRGLRRMYPGTSEIERLVVVDHPALEHDWLWDLIDAYRKTDVGLRQDLDLDEGVTDEVLHTDPLSDDGVDEDSIAPDSLVVDLSEEIDLPDPEPMEDKPLGKDWRDYLGAVVYPLVIVTVTHEERTGETERDLAGTGFVRSIEYSSTNEGFEENAGFKPDRLTIGDLQREILEQVFGLTVEVLFNNGLPVSGRANVYAALLVHLSDKFLDGKTIGQCVDEYQLRALQDALHDVRRTFDRRELLRAILEDPPGDADSNPIFHLGQG